jgi:hypothetical protein
VAAAREAAAASAFDEGEANRRFFFYREGGISLM